MLAEATVEAEVFLGHRRDRDRAVVAEAATDRPEDQGHEARAALEVVESVR